MPKFTDQEVVAAINSCLDLKKLDQLPTGVVDRFKNLIRKKRIGAVCFFRTAGFGLRVYHDHFVYEMKFDGVDMAEVKPIGDAPGRLNLEPVWVQCDASLFAQAVEQKEYIVASKDGRKFLRPWLSDYDEEDPHTNPVWDGARRRATVFASRELAAETAERVGGVVLEKE